MKASTSHRPIRVRSSGSMVVTFYTISGDFILTHNTKAQPVTSKSSSSTSPESSAVCIWKDWSPYVCFPASSCDGTDRMNSGHSCRAASDNGLRFAFLQLDQFDVIFESTPARDREVSRSNQRVNI